MSFTSNVSSSFVVIINNIAIKLSSLRNYGQSSVANTHERSSTQNNIMVNLPEPSRQDVRAMGERGSERMQQPRSHHNWGMRSGRRRMEFRNVEPAGLLELEQLAHKTVALMEKHGTKSTSNFQKAMELLRLQYNLNFIVLCERCRGPHVNDEMLAPER